MLMHLIRFRRAVSPLSLQSRINTPTWRGMARLVRPRPTLHVSSRTRERSQREHIQRLHTSNIIQRPETNKTKRKKAMEEEDEGMDFVIDPEEVQEVVEHAKENWPTHPSLPSDWSSDWSKWTHLLTFFYPAPYYFLRLPQIEMFVNIRHAVRGEVVPLMYSNEREGLIFTTIRRTSAQLSPRFYYLDWRTQELFRIEEESATSEKKMVQAVRDYGGIDRVNMVKLRPDPEGDKLVERILDHDDTVIPILGEKYLEYTPAPTEALLDHYLEEADALTGVTEEEGSPTKTKELEDIMELMRGKIPEDQEGDMTRLLYELQAQAPEEVAGLAEMAKKLDNMTPEQAVEVTRDIQEAMAELMDDVSESGKTLAKLLNEAKKRKAAT